MMNDKEREALLNEFLTEEGDITIMKEKAKYHESNSPFKGLKNLKLNEIKDVNRPRTAARNRRTTPRRKRYLCPADWMSGDMMRR